MKLWKRFRNEAPPTEISADDPAEKIAAFFGVEEIGEEKLKSATYYACMQIRCNSIAKLPLKIMQSVGDSAEPAKEHPLYRLLHRRPNPYMTIHDFLWATEYEKLTYGNAYWYPMYGRDGRISQLYLLHSPNVTILIDDVGTIDSSHQNRVFYQYSDPKEGIQIFPEDAICHFKNFPCGGIAGTGVRKYLSDVIDNEKYAGKVLKSKYKNGLQDPVIVQFMGDLGADIQQKIRKKFETLGGAQNAGKVIPIPPDYKVEQLETKLVNNQFFQLQGLTTKHIANGFGVKSFQLNDLERSTYANIENQNRSYYSDTLMNVLTEYEQEIDEKLFSTEEQKQYFAQFNVDSFLRSDIEKRYQSYQIGIASGFLKISEAREKENLPFVEGTDQLIIGNGASVPLEKLGQQYEKGGERNENENL